MHIFRLHLPLVIRLAFQITFLVLLTSGAVGNCFCQEKKSSHVPKINFPADAESGAGYRKNRLEFFLKLIKIYEKDTKDGFEFRQRAKQYLRSSISYNTDQVYREDKAWKSASELSEAGKQLLDDGCQDPLVLMFHARVLNTIKYSWGRNVGLTEQNRPISFLPNEDAFVVAQRALKEFEGSAYPRGLKILFLGALNNAVDASERRKKIQELVQDDLNVLESIPKWIGFVKGMPDWERIAYSVMQRHPTKDDVYREVDYSEKANGGSQFAKIKELGSQQLQSAWLYQMMLADHYNGFPKSRRLASRNFGEAARKKLLAGVTEKAKQARRLAVKHYEAAHEVASKHPEAAAHLIMLAYEEYETDDRWAWFQRAIDAEVDNPGAYYYLLLTSDRLTSKALVELAYQFYESDRFDTAIPQQFLYCLYKLDWFEYANLMARDDKLFETTRDLFVKYAQEDGVSIEDSMLTQRQINDLRSLVRIAARAKRFDVAVKYAQLLDQMSSNWFALTKDRVSLHSMIHAWNNYPNELRDIGFDFSQNRVRTPGIDLGDLADRYEALVENCDPLSAPYLKACAALANQFWEYDKGGWVRLGCEFPTDHLWGIRGNFLCKDGGTFDVSNSPKMISAVNDSFCLSYKGEFALPREIQCDMNLLSWKGLPEYGIQSYASVCMFNLKSNMGLASVQGRVNGKYTEQWVSIPGLKPRKPVRLAVRVWDKANFQFFVDGTLVDTPDNLELDKADGSIGFLGRSYFRYPKPGEEAPIGPEIAVEVSNVRIRKLDFAPPPKRDQPEKGLEYFTEAIARSPELAFNYLRRADCNDQLNNIEEAISDFRNGLQRDARFGRDRIRFVQLCLSTEKYAQAQRSLSEVLDQLRATENTIRDAESTAKPIKGKKNAGKKKIEKLIERELTKIRVVDRNQLQATIANCEEQMLVLYGACPKDSVRSSKFGQEILKTIYPENNSRSATGCLARAYVQAELKQYDQANESLKAATEAAGGSEATLKKIKAASQAVQKREPIRLSGDQLVVLKDLR